MIITKKEIIQKLYDIEEKEGLSLGREVQKVVRSEVVPIEIISFINKYDTQFLQIYDTYNVIYLSRNKNPLYRNLRNENLSIEEVAIAISSLVTKILISRSKISDINDKNLFTQAMNLDRLNIALSEYALNNEPNNLIQCSKEVRELLNILYEN